MTAPSHSQSTNSPQWLEFRSSSSFITSVVAVAIFTDIFLYGLIIPIVPFALEDIIGVEKDDVQQWVSILLAVYGGTSLLGSPIFGYFADRYGSRRIPFLAGLICLAAGTLLFVIGRSLATLVAARALQGVSASAVWVVGLSMIVDTFGKDHVGQAIGVVGIAMTAAILSGPVVGGIIFDLAGYAACFAPAICLIAVDVLMRLFMIEKKEAEKWLHQQAPINGNSDSPNYGSFKTNIGHEDSEHEACASVSARYNLLSQRALECGRSDEEFQHCSTNTKSWLKKLPYTLQMLANPRLCIVLWNTLIFLTIYSALESTIPLHLMRTFHWGSSQAGVALLALMLPSLLGTFIGRYVDNRGPRMPATLGFLVLSPALILLFLVSTSSIESKAILILLLVVIGTGACALDVSLMTEVCLAVGEIEDADNELPDGGILRGKSAIAQAYGLFNTALSGGQMLGPLGGGLIKDAAGWKGMVICFGVLSAVMVVPAAIWTGGWIGKRSTIATDDNDTRTDGAASSLT